MKNLALRDHLSLYWSSYLVGAIILAVVVGVVFMALKEPAERDNVANWPVAKAEILKSEFATAVTQDQTGSEGTISARLLLRCRTPGKSWTVHYLQYWPVSTATLCQQLLPEGKEIEVRYSPSDPNIISLYPLLSD
ncbi:hypothetical protein BH09VER1_BH09VER1_41420 [soil metagenome]